MSRWTPITVKFRGEDRALHELCTEFGIAIQTAMRRLSSGWKPEQAITSPVRSYRVLPRRRANPPAAPREPLSRTMPSQLLEDAEALVRECLGVLRDAPLSSRRQSVAISNCEQWLRRRAPSEQRSANC